MEHPHPKHERGPEAGSSHGHAMHEGRGHYARLLAMVALSYVAMYLLMYAMVDRLDNVYNNVNQAWMAGLMAAPMLVIELTLMRGMYPDRKKNALLLAAGILVAVVCWLMIRQQTAVTKNQFLRSMIPHHAGAILMCEERKGRDGPEVQALCAEILASQRDEIRTMEKLLQKDRSP